MPPIGMKLVKPETSRSSSMVPPDVERQKLAEVVKKEQAAHLIMQRLLPINQERWWHRLFGYGTVKKVWAPSYKHEDQTHNKVTFPWLERHVGSTAVALGIQEEEIVGGKDRRGQYKTQPTGETAIKVTTTNDGSVNYPDESMYVFSANQREKAIDDTLVTLASFNSKAVRAVLTEAGARIPSELLVQ